MKSLKDFRKTPTKIRALFSDIDDTMTTGGQLHANAYGAMWTLQRSGIGVIPVTGRPAGWCEMIARLWPVVGVIGENGGLYFRYDHSNRKMIRQYAVDPNLMAINRKKLDLIQSEILTTVKGSAVASDQFCRLMDLAIDFAEDVGPLPDINVDKIVSVFKKHGAQAKVSSIHVNGWFGDYDKLSMCKTFVTNELKSHLQTDNQAYAFAGDSPNDEPMFEFFKNSFAVANIRQFASRIQHLPQFVADHEGGEGFVDIANALIANADPSFDIK